MWTISYFSRKVFEEIKSLPGGIKIMKNENWHEELREEVLSDPALRFEYEIFKRQLDLAQKMKQARKKRGLTQEQVAEKMHTKKPVVARLESGGGRLRHSPSLSTLEKYAQAIGYHLKIMLVKNERLSV